MKFESENHSPVMSPISSTDEEDELEYEKVLGNDFSQEYLEPSLPQHLLIHQNNPQTQQSEDIEPFSKQNTAVLNEVHLCQQEECNSENSYAALKEESSANIPDSDNSILRNEEGDL